VTSLAHRDLEDISDSQGNESSMISQAWNSFSMPMFKTLYARIMLNVDLMLSHSQRRLVPQEIVRLAAETLRYHRHSVS
jgi:hypothetical protein